MPKLEELDIEETSGVDHPAHLASGWLMMKSSASLESLLKANLRECPQCGESVSDQEGYCPNCGERLAKAQRPLTELEKLARLRELHKALGEALGEGGGMTTKDGVPEEVAEFLAEAPENIRKSIEEAFVPPEPEGSEEEQLLKDVPEAVRKMLDEERSKREELEKAIATERERRETEEAVAKSRDWSILGVEPDEFGPVLQKLRSENEDTARIVESVLDGAAKVAETSEMFRTIGKSSGGGGSDAEGRLDALTREAMTKGADYATAYAEVLETAEGARLYAERQSEREGGR